MIKINFLNKVSLKLRSMIFYMNKNEILYINIRLS